MKSVQFENSCQLTGDQWTAAAARLGGFDLVFVVAYFEDTIGPVGTNLQRLHDIAEFVTTLNTPFIGIWSQTRS